MAAQYDDVPLTQGAHDEMQKELDYLRTVRRREIAEEIRNVLDTELDKDFDIATPFESVKEDQAWVEGRIASLEDTLARARIIDEAAARRSTTVQVGSVVVVENGDGEHVYQIVSSAESDPAAGKLSFGSPVGSALMGKAAGDTVEVKVPAGMHRLRIKELR